MLIPKFLFQFLVCLILVWVVNAGGKTYADVLYGDLFADYNKDLLPQWQEDAPVVINITLSLFGIREFDELTGKFSVMAELHLSWTDFRLKWDPSVYNISQRLVIPKKKIWTPNLVLINPYDSLKGFVDDVFPVTLRNDGKVIWIPSDIISSVCDVDVTYYPFDIQICRLEFLCAGYNRKSVVLNNPSPEVSLTHYSKHGEWKLLNATYPIKHGGYIVAEIAMQRRSTFIVLNIILPVVCMAVLNLFVFILPIESGERVSYAITVFLAIAVFFTLVSDNLPKTSFRTAIIMYIMLSFLNMSAVICVLVILSSSLYYTDGERPVPQLLVRADKKFRLLKVHKTKKCVLEENGENPLSNYDSAVTWKNLSRWLDNFAIGICLLAITASVIFIINIMMH